MIAYLWSTIVLAIHVYAWTLVFLAIVGGAWYLIARKRWYDGSENTPLGTAIPPRDRLWFIDGVELYGANLRCELAARGRERLLCSVSVSQLLEDGTRFYTVLPEGLNIDGASVPALFWVLVGHPLSGSSKLPAGVHDFLCGVGRLQRELPRDVVLTSLYPHKFVHRVFHRMLLQNGVAPLRAWLMWKAVDWFGPKWAMPDAPAEVAPNGEVIGCFGSTEQ